MLAATPALAVITASALSPETAIRGFGVAVGAIGLSICGLVRDKGRQLEPALWASWGGTPTVRRLRWRDAHDTESVRRLHDRLNALLAHPLPNAHEEARDRAAADRRYDEAVASLRELTRDTSRFRLLFAENVEYGFRRNSLGLRPVALGIAAGALAMSASVLGWQRGGGGEHWARWGIPAALSVAAILYWWRIVNSEWVRRSAELYADRLFESIETLVQDRR